MKRPTLVTVVGILAIVFGGLGLVTGTIGLVMMALSRGVEDSNPVFAAMASDPVLNVHSWVSAVLALVAAGAEIAFGIGVLSLRPWARRLGLVWGWYCVVAWAIGMYMAAAHLIPALDAAASDGSAAADAARLGAKIGLASGACLGLVLPIVVLVGLTRPNVVEAFSGRSAPDPEFPPPEKA